MRPGISRRNFIKTASACAGSHLLFSGFTVRAGQLDQSAVVLPAWWNPPELPVRDGGNNPDADPAVIPKNGQVIRDTHFSRWRADGIWPQSKRSGVVFAWKTDPEFSWQLENCRFSDCWGEVVTGHYGMNLRDLWFENLSNIGVMASDPMTLYGRNLNFVNVCQDHPDIIWDHAGAIKVTGFSATEEPWVDLDGIHVFNCWNGPYFWADTGPVIRKLWNASFTGGCRCRGLMFELAAGSPDWIPTLKNIEVAHTNYEKFKGQPWNNVFNGVVLLMNSKNITAENLTIITPPHASAFAFQDDDRRHEKSGLAPAVLRDLDFCGGLIVLRGDDSTLERHYWHAPGKNGAGENIRIRDFEVWVEAASLSEARARCSSPFASDLNIKTMTAQEIDEGLIRRGQAHLLESRSAHPRFI
jgi:hypothetical protein